MAEAAVVGTTANSARLAGAGLAGVVTRGLFGTACCGVDSLLCVGGACPA